MDRSAFGRLLREARQRSLLTLESLAEASGVSVRAISDMERGRSLPRRATLKELMDALQCGAEERQLLVQASTPRTQEVPRQLPPDLAVFRGREEALAAVHGFTSQVSASGRHVVISAIGGMAGVGKTTLAVHWAHQVAATFPDGQLYVNLRGFEAENRPLDPGQVLGGFLRALGTSSSAVPSGTQERAALFRERTSSSRLLVLLDNALDAEQVRPLLPAAPGCLAIITSRNQLAGLAVAEGASLISLDVWTPAEALAALGAKIGEERCLAEPEAAGELVRLCGYLPLAVAIVGAQLRAVPRTPLRLVVRELREDLPRLDALSVDDQRANVRAVFSWSYQALTTETARFFRHLALHPGPSMSPEAAASLAGVGMARAQRCLRALISASLLTRDADGGYVLHDLVRAYTTELLEQEQDDRLLAQKRLLDYLRHNAYPAGQVLDTRPSPRPSDAPAPGVVRVVVDSREDALDWFRREEPTATAALRSMDDPRLLRHRATFADDWGSYYAVQGRWTAEIQLLRLGADASLELDDPVASVRNRMGLARALAEMGRVEEADAELELVIGLLDRLDPTARAVAERSIGWVRGRQGRYTEALQHARNALAGFQALGDRSREARERNAVGWYLALMGEYQEAITMCESALPLLREAGNRRSEAATWDSIGYATQRLGNLDAAVSHYEKSLQLYGEVLDDYSRAEVLDHLASAQLERGDTAEAKASWTRAGDLLSALNSANAMEMRAKAEELAGPSPLPPGRR